MAYIHGEFEINQFSVSTSKDDDAGTGIWVDGGVYWNFAKHWNVGVDLRYSKTNVKLYNTNGEAGGFYYGIFLGLHSW